jgi:hypothetical protein
VGAVILRMLMGLIALPRLKLFIDLTPYFSPVSAADNVSVR